MHNYKGTDGAYKLADYIWEMLVNTVKIKIIKKKTCNFVGVITTDYYSIIVLSYASLIII